MELKLLCLVCVLVGLLFGTSCTAATTYTVGDTAGWDISADLDTWPIDKNFKVGDSLMFQYAQPHSVSEVTKDRYDGCNTTTALKTYTDGNSNITLSKPGDMYFVCGNRLHCLGGMKLQIYVRESQAAYAPAPAPTSGRSVLPEPNTKKNNPARAFNPISAGFANRRGLGESLSFITTVIMFLSL